MAKKINIVHLSFKFKFMARKPQVSQSNSDMDTDSCRRKRECAFLVTSCCSELLVTEQPKEKKKSIRVKEWLRKKDRIVYNISDIIFLVPLTQISF